ncbi:MAG: flavodoxin family protein [Gammaproteobacteria bacterium]|nr:flavodoxin family protein [Gammaproteobacteria bacterium]
MKKTLLIVAHQPSPNTQNMVAACVDGTAAAETDDVLVSVIAPLECQPEQLLAADAVIIITTENLGYMAGATKDWFDRIYYPVLELKQGLPYALVIRAGLDGTGTQRAVASICTGLRWNLAQPVLLCKGDWQDTFSDQCFELGQYMAGGLDLGMF